MRIPARLRRVSTNGVNLIARYEGLAELRADGRIHPYNDPVGYATIGYGHLIRLGPVHSSDKSISKQQALALLRKDIKQKAAEPVRQVLTAAKYRPTQNEFDALVSFAFNLGPGVLKGDHSIARAIRSRKRLEIANALLLYDKANGKTLPGLHKRRADERRVFLS